MVIPKNSAPSSLFELRNISCTPLLSKVLESFILDKLRSETELSERQYGGIKGSSPEHFLIDTWDNIVTTLEQKDKATNLISVDFSKAFNRMHHYKCLEALVDLGAEMETVDWVASFLFGRTMSVKIDNVFSEPKSVPGGSPQGSILGNFLFCTTTNCFTQLDGEESIVTADTTTNTSESDESDDAVSKSPVPAIPYSVSTPTARGQFTQFNTPRTLQDLSGSYISEDESFDFFRQRRAMPFDSSESDASTEESIYCLLYTSDAADE